jgi:hypothetical protein
LYFFIARITKKGKAQEFGKDEESRERYGEKKIERGENKWEPPLHCQTLATPHDHCSSIYLGSKA